jgi:hypothetical protein
MRPCTIFHLYRPETLMEWAIFKKIDSLKDRNACLDSLRSYLENEWLFKELNII